MRGAFGPNVDAQFVGVHHEPCLGVGAVGVIVEDSGHGSAGDIIGDVVVAVGHEPVADAGDAPCLVVFEVVGDGAVERGVGPGERQAVVLADFTRYCPYGGKLRLDGPDGGCQRVVVRNFVIRGRYRCLHFVGSCFRETYGSFHGCFLPGFERGYGELLAADRHGGAGKRCVAVVYHRYGYGHLLSLSHEGGHREGGEGGVRGASAVNLEVVEVDVCAPGGHSLEGEAVPVGLRQPFERDGVFGPAGGAVVALIYR